MRLSPLVVALVAATFPSQGDGNGASAIARQIERELTGAGVPGAAVAIVSGEEVLAIGHGVADASSGAAMAPDTLLQAGSVTKVFTALAVNAALDGRGLPLTTPVGDVMPGLGARTAAATFHELLSQTSGLRDRQGDTGDHDELALAAAARALSPADFLLPPGVVFSYSNPGYALAGAALESLVRKGFAEALRESVLTPLGMARSTIRPSEVRARPHATGHRLQGQTAAPIDAPANDTRIWPAGYLWTNAGDMSRSLQALLHGGRVPGHPGLPPAIVARVTTPHTPMPNVFAGGHYGYGLMIARDRGVRIYEHGGTMPGFSAIVRVAPDRGLAVAILANLENAPLRRIAQAAMATALGLPAPEPRARNETAVSAAEMQEFVGRYENRGSAEIAVRDGTVVLILDEGPPLAVTRIGDDRFLARPTPGAPGPEFVLRPAAGQAPPYLHFALWAYVRR